MEYTIRIDDFTAEEWETHAKLFSDYTIYQTWAYQEIRAQMDGQGLSRAIIADDAGNAVVMCHVRTRKLTPAGPCIGYVQWGPLLRHKESGPLLDAKVFQLLRDAYLKGKVDVLRLVPNVVADESGLRVAAAMEEAGFSLLADASPYRTILVPVHDGEEAIRAGFHGSWRSYLKKAEKGNIQIQEGDDQECFTILEQTYAVARARKGFEGLDPQIFIQAQKRLSAAEKMHVIIAICDGQPVTAHASSYLGEMGEGILAGSNEKGLTCGASYVVWWKTLLAAHHRGMRVYNLGGIDPVGNPKVYEFKKRMGGEECSHVGAFQASSGRLTHSLVGWGERLHKYYCRARS